MFFDRGSGLLSVAADFGLNLKFCTLHIIRNIAHQFEKLSQSQKNLVWRLQAAMTCEEYTSILGLIEMDMGPAVKSYVSSIDPVRWCVHANIGVTTLRLAYVKLRGKCLRISACRVPKADASI
ncbi:hypothetical protein PR002_g11952 [Phytophthora rubi]|uniref:MULE transposase domain-containing protein n=1 Tax=Phytophthora rubi TaxID=129364 RepID=A0A6A3LWQ5_9STRA|nr:hypothetical protein PR002_g11952 [Phytophthora rubi]